MARKMLTDRALKALKPAPDGKPYDVMDIAVPGLGVRVMGGGRRTFSAVLLIQLVPLALPLFAHSWPWLTLEALVGGLTAAGLTGLTLVRAREIAGDQASGIWRLGTIAWAAAQMASGFVMAWAYTATGSHAAVFAIGLAGAVLALLAGRK